MLTSPYFAAERRSRPGFVYAIRGSGSSAIKLGCSAQPRVRLASLQTGNPDELRIINTVPCTDMYAVEERVHAKFAREWIRGEWFRVDEEQVRALFQTIAFFEHRGVNARARRALMI